MYVSTRPFSQLTHTRYHDQAAELVVLIHGENKTFFRFDDMISARLFAMQVGELQSFFIGTDMHVDFI